MRRILTKPESSWTTCCRADVERQLAQSEAVQIPLHSGVQGPKNIPAIDTFKPMTLDYAKAADRVEDATKRLAGILGL